MCLLTALVLGSLLGVLLAAMALPEARCARLGAHRVHYQVIGEGEPTLVLVHGWGCSGEFWRANVPALAHHHRVLVLDLPGHGRSDCPALDYSMPVLAQAVEAVLREAGVGRAVGVGHSMGALVLCRLQRDDPGRLAGLVAVDASLCGYPVTAAQRAEFLARFRGENYRGEAGQFIRALFRRHADPALREGVVEAVLQTPQHVLGSAFAGILDHAAWQPVAIEVPLLMLNAPSPLWDARYRAQVREIAPRSELRLVPGAGHFLMLEQPEVFNDAVRRFAAQFPPPRHHEG